jgi:hypothetical protein
MHTPAEIQVTSDGTTARLSQGSARLEARILTPPRARFTVTDAGPLPSSPHPGKQANNNGARKLVIHLNGVTALRLADLFVPLREGETSPKGDPEVFALNQW